MSSGQRRFATLRRHTGLAGLLPLALLLLTSCTQIPEGITPVENFDSERYLGRWYEIARLDHSFERGLDNVTAEYVRREDGGLDVINRGYSTAKQEWKQAEGRAYFVDAPDRGHLKVSFFGPFYGSYVVFGLDQPEYQHAFVAGYNKSYLWLLSRTPQADEQLVARFVDQARQLGFDTSQLIFVAHDNASPTNQE
jgi:apolipoprotein D and lipocalin family protein